MKYSFENLNKDHAKEVIDIFNYYIENSFAAYPSSKLPYEFIYKFLEMTNGYPAYAIKNEENKKIVGFCFLRPYNPMPTFSKTAEITYFIDKDEVGKGIGRMALELLEKDAAMMGIKNILASIASKNEQSLSFHANNGFMECGRLKNIAKKHGETFDIVYMQKVLE